MNNNRVIGAVAPPRTRTACMISDSSGKEAWTALHLEELVLLRAVGWEEAAA